MKATYILLAASAAAVLALANCASTRGASAQTPAAQTQVKTVYHINEGLEQASNGLRNIRNHLTADPSAKIVVVAHSHGIDFLLDGAEDKDKNPYSAIVKELAAKGVEFRACNFTLRNRNIDKSKVIPQATIVPSGVAEVTKLQAREGYVYFKP